MATTWQHGGLCACGCGEKTNLARFTQKKNSIKKGEPYEFVYQHQHNNRRVGYVVAPVTGCHVWQGQPSQKYPSIKVGGRQLKTHIYFWEQAHGPVPRGMVLHHVCENTRCMNVAHLEVVTAASNTHVGASSKLSAATADAIRRLAAGGYSRTKLAEMYGVTPESIRNVLTGRTWRPAELHKPFLRVRRDDGALPFLGGDD